MSNGHDNQCEAILRPRDAPPICRCDLRRELAEAREVIVLLLGFEGCEGIDEDVKERAMRVVR